MQEEIVRLAITAHRAASPRCRHEDRRCRQGGQKKSWPLPMTEVIGFALGLAIDDAGSLLGEGPITTSQPVALVLETPAGSPTRSVGASIVSSEQGRRRLEPRHFGAGGAY